MTPMKRLSTANAAITVIIVMTVVAEIAVVVDVVVVVEVVQCGIGDEKPLESGHILHFQITPHSIAFQFPPHKRPALERLPVCFHAKMIPQILFNFGIRLLRIFLCRADIELRSGRFADNFLKVVGKNFAGNLKGMCFGIEINRRDACVNGMASACGKRRKAGCTKNKQV